MPKVEEAFLSIGAMKEFFDAAFLKPRARQNVVLEFGYFIGLLGRDRVCCLYKGDIELPSDMHGIVYIPFKESVNEVRDKLIKELKVAGYKIEI
jgi:predicted nucleotide-binding protein